MFKPKILYYSDCSFFAGCENMLIYFLTNEQLNSVYSTVFIYRYSDIYRSGLANRINIDEHTIFNVNIPDNDRMLSFIKTKIKNRFLRRVIAFPLILMWKYYCVLISTFVLYKRFKKLKIDILHINNGGYPAAPSCYSALIAAKLCGINKIIYVVNNIAEGYKSPLRWLDYFLDIYVKNNVQYFITGSKYASQQLNKILNISTKKLINIANGVKPKEIIKTVDEVRRQYAIPNGRLLFLLGAVLEKRKGHIYLLEAIRELRKTIGANEMPIFIFAGDGIEKNNIEAFVHKNDLQELVILTGNVLNIFDLINAADVLVLPSISHEDFPFIIIEGMSLGKPVIGTAIAGITEQIVNNETGLIVPPKDSSALIHTIKELMNKKRREKFGIEGLKRFNTNYTTNKSIDQYFMIYNQLNIKFKPGKHNEPA